jgi:hypothetical protein
VVVDGARLNNRSEVLRDRSAGARQAGICHQAGRALAINKPFECRSVLLTPSFRPMSGGYIRSSAGPPSRLLPVHHSSPPTRARAIARTEPLRHDAPASSSKVLKEYISVIAAQTKLLKGRHAEPCLPSPVDRVQSRRGENAAVEVLFPERRARSAVLQTDSWLVAFLLVTARRKTPISSCGHSTSAARCGCWPWPPP